MTNQDGVSALVGELRLRWQICRDASVDKQFSSNERMAWGGRAGGILEAIEMVEAAADALSRSPSVRVDDEMVERATRAFHDCNWRDPSAIKIRASLQAALTKATP